MKILLLILATFITSIGFSQTSDSFQYDGLNRSFIYYTPLSWTQNESLPILFVLHGLLQNANSIMNITDFNNIAEANNFIVCYPDGINSAWNANMNVSVSQVDDIGFLEELSIYLQNNLNTDPSKQYLVGFSNGGFMCNKMLCESSLCFAASATIAGTMSDTVYQNCTPINSTNILHIHGTLDTSVPYGGSLTTGVSVENLMEFWRGYYNCDISPSMSTMSNVNLLDLSYPEKYSYTNCNNVSIEHIKIIGGGHQWPGILTAIGGVGQINMDFYSPQTIWDFLEEKTCSLAAVDSELILNKKKEIITILDFVGREVEIKPNTPLIYIYSDGTTEKKYHWE